MLRGSRGRGRSMDWIAFTRPGRLENTTTRSDRVIASARSCVTKMMVLRAPSQMRINSPCISNLSCASSAPKGSSINSVAGS